jgi:hypothetical protein
MIKIDPNMIAHGVEVRGDVLTIDDLNLAGIAEALAAGLRDAIRDQPGDKWNKTGTLVRGVKASESAVAVPSDRLDSPDLAERFAKEVMPPEPLADKRVVEATVKAIDESVSAKRRAR